MKYKKFIDLADNLSVKTDKYNWILDKGDKNTPEFFPSLDMLIDELLETEMLRRAKSKKIDEVSLSVLSEFVKDGREAAWNYIEAIEKKLTDADTARKKGEI